MNTLPNDKKLILFDIDGTILLGTGKHPEAMKDCFKELFNIDVTPDVVNGPTDLFIVYKIMDAYNIEKTPENIKKIVDKISQIFQAKDISGTKVLPGVKELLKKIHSEKNIFVGLVTGNIKDIAYFKLKKFGLDKYFTKGVLAAYQKLGLT
jgi:phosphoglycolate phosphatase-like HAD superfamily hydrolase